MKNSSRFEEKMAQNFTRSSSGCFSSADEVEHAGVELDPRQLAVEEAGLVVGWEGCVA